MNFTGRVVETIHAEMKRKIGQYKPEVVCLTKVLPLVLERELHPAQSLLQRRRYKAPFFFKF